MSKFTPLEGPEPNWNTNAKPFGYDWLAESEIPEWLKVKLSIANRRDLENRKPVTFYFKKIPQYGV